MRKTHVQYVSCTPPREWPQEQEGPGWIRCEQARHARRLLRFQYSRRREDGRCARTHALNYYWIGVARTMPGAMAA